MLSLLIWAAILFCTICILDSKDLESKKARKMSNKEFGRKYNIKLWGG